MVARPAANASGMTPAHETEMQGHCATPLSCPATSPCVYLPLELQAPYSKRTQASKSRLLEGMHLDFKPTVLIATHWCGLPCCIINACRDPDKWSDPRNHHCKANKPASEENDCALSPNRALPMRATIRATQTGTAPICKRSGRHLHSTLAMRPILGSNDLHHIH